MLLWSKGQVHSSVFTTVSLPQLKLQGQSRWDASPLDVKCTNMHTLITMQSLQNIKYFKENYYKFQIYIIQQTLFTDNLSYMRTLYELTKYCSLIKYNFVAVNFNCSRGSDNYKCVPTPLLSLTIIHIIMMK